MTRLVARISGPSSAPRIARASWVSVWLALLVGLQALAGCAWQRETGAAESQKKGGGAGVAGRSSDPMPGEARVRAALPLTDLELPSAPWLLRPASTQPVVLSEVRLASTGSRDESGVVRSGVGVPVVAVFDPGVPNQPPGGFRVPLTIVPVPAASGDAVSRWAFVDPLRIGAFERSGEEHPLAMNLIAPVRAASRVGPGPLEGLRNMLRSDRFGSSELRFFQPYDPDKIPVVLIHGLMSTPQMWAEVLKNLLAEPEIRAHYQFWGFYYPTGKPVPYTALELREALDQAIPQGARLLRSPVLIGHSMGGILARTTVTGIDAVSADRILPGVSELPPGSRVRQALVFPPSEGIGRVVYLATPHRGSAIADRFIGRIGISLIRLPASLADEVRDQLPDRWDFGRRPLPTSIDGLSPRSRFLDVLDGLPSGVPEHSIIGNRGSRLPLEQTSDGIVPFESAHRPEVLSERVVAAGHGVQSHPEAIEELKRILLLHLSETQR